MEINKEEIREGLKFYNTEDRKLEDFKPIQSPHVGMYVCGPTVYGDAHLGHARPAVTFDILFRYLSHLDYKVRYVRNITDVGHLEHDSDDGEDKIAKKARLEQIEPMEVVQHYLTAYHHNMEALNVLPPSIEPMASAHIQEQIELTQEILDNGFAYVSGGSVYFDVEKYDKKYNYGRLSGRNVEDMRANTRQLAGQEEKRNPLDFALWKEASPEHIMKWKSPWGIGFPGWHCECTAMGRKYLGDQFDIHGGGLDLVFPHHECEIAQAVAAMGHPMVHYWLHNNLITINGQKMGKSLGNFITLDEVFSGKHKLLDQAYDPMTVRFFVLMAHYRSQLDFSNQALQAAEKGLTRLHEAYKALDTLKPSATQTTEVRDFIHASYEHLNDDLNTPQVVAELFDAARVINTAKNGDQPLTEEQISDLRQLFDTFLYGVLGMRVANAGLSSQHQEAFDGAMDLLLDLRQQAKDRKDWTVSDEIRDRLTALGFVVKDTKDGAEWSI
ncbi:cysteine--tRNA ligase [uncultured Porphyromonas sp.]|uniref:cysteine--tRNA ligase n=1 Tax=uncultured Porphyromonas sp. TaxID=159274 RepID=UPI002608F4FA|nr:cysteine--tRNA ligase [uncultured Porphyromonas sp.]